MKEENISFKIMQIKSERFSVSAPEGFDLEDALNNQLLQFKLHLDINGDLYQDILNIVVKFSLSLDEENKELTGIIVRNTFEIANLKTIVIENSLPIGFRQYLSNIALDHSRGVHASKVTETQLEKAFIPVIEITDVDFTENYIN